MNNKASGAETLRGDGGQVILDVAIEEFSTLRSTGTSIERIAELADVNPAVLLSHYKTLDSLWTAAVTQLFDEAAEAMKTHLAEAGMQTPDAPVRGLVNGLVAFVAKRPQHFRILLLEEREDNDRLQWIIQQSTGSIFAISKMMIERAQKAGAMRQGDPASLYYSTVGLVIARFIWSTQYQQMTGRDPFSDADKQEVTQFALEFLGINPN